MEVIPDMERPAETVRRVAVEEPFARRVEVDIPRDWVATALDADDTRLDACAKDAIALMEDDAREEAAVTAVFLLRVAEEERLFLAFDLD